MKTSRWLLALPAAALLLAGCGGQSAAPAPAPASPAPAPSAPAPSTPAPAPSQSEKPAVPPAEVVRQYYALAAKGDWATAWTLLHPSDQVDFATHSTEQRKAQFLAQKPGPQLVKAEDGPVLDEYKFYSTQLRQTNVATVKATFADGSTRTLHLLPDAQNQWRVFWVPGPDPGLE